MEERIPQMEERRYRQYRKLANCGNRSKEPQPKYIARRYIRGIIVVIPCLKSPQNRGFHDMWRRRIPPGASTKIPKPHFSANRMWCREPLRTEYDAGIYRCDTSLGDIGYRNLWEKWYVSASNGRGVHTDHSWPEYIIVSSSCPRCVCRRCLALIQSAIKFTVAVLVYGTCMDYEWSQVHN